MPIYILSLLFAITIAFLLGRIMQKIRMPAILGWLIAGMALGPYAFNILSLQLMDNAWFHILIELFESFVGIMIGSELIVKQLKKSGKQIFVIAFLEAFMTFVVVSIAFAILLYVLNLPLYLAVIFGAIALATAPAPSLSIVNEYKTKGPVTDTLLPIVALDDILAISVFLVVMTSIVNAFSQQSFSIYLIFAITLLPLILGALMGFIFTLLAKLTTNRKNYLVLFIGCLLIANIIGITMNHYVLEKPLFNFMLIGMSYACVVVNLFNEQKAHQLLGDFRPILGIGLIVVILNLGAPLDYKLIASAGIFTVIYIVARAIGKIGGAYTGARLTKAPSTVRKYLGLTLLPHSGVSLIFTGIAATALFKINPDSALLIQSTIAAAAVINEVIAVILAKKAFMWAQEINV